MSKVHVIFDDSRGVYFKELGLGIFWVCVSKREEAREFRTRAAAAKVLRDNGKNRDGWRVLTVGAAVAAARRIA